MSFFFDPSKTPVTPLTDARLELDKNFVIGISGDVSALDVSFASGGGHVDEVASKGRDIRQFRITPRVPGKQILRAASFDGKAAFQISVDIFEPATLGEDIVYTGQKLVWFHNLPKGTPVTEFEATSGLPDSQSSSFMKIKDHGPVPTGLYRFWARRDPKRQASLVNRVAKPAARAAARLAAS